MLTRALILLFLIPSVGSLCAEEYDYRLSGIIATDIGGAVAIIEVSDGNEEMYKEGDVIGDGYIASINKQSVKLVIGENERLLYLTGVGLNDIDIVEPPSPLNDVIVSEIIFKIAEMSEKAAMKDKEIIGTALNAALGLPEEAIITSVNEQDVNSTRTVLQKLTSILSYDEPPPLSFSITGVEGMDRIYRFPMKDDTLAQ